MLYLRNCFDFLAPKIMGRNWKISIENNKTKKCVNLKCPWNGNSYEICHTNKIPLTFLFFVAFWKIFFFSKKLTIFETGTSPIFLFRWKVHNDDLWATVLRMGVTSLVRIYHTVCRKWNVNVVCLTFRFG